MKPIPRREFLRRTALVAGALAGGWLLNGCGEQPALSPAPSVPTGAAPTGTPAPSTAAATPAPSATSAGYPHLAVARNGEPEEMVRRALAALGGIERFVRPGDNVIVKPNICVAYHTYEYAATTNPWVVGALVRLCREAGAGRVRVMDQPFGGTPEEAYAVSGIQEQVLAAGGEMEIMAAYKYVPADMPGAISLSTCDIYDEVLDADVLIDVPIAKHHGLATLTLGMKNLMGVIRDREAIHADIANRLSDLTDRLRPALTVVDAVRVLMANGPTGGNLGDVQQFNTVIASADIVAADAYAATLIGRQPETIGAIRAGADRGLGRRDLENLVVEEIDVGT